MTDRKEELKKLIQEAREAYYNLDPNVSDQQYDAWVDELTKLEPNAVEITAVGAEPSKISVWEKVKHEIPMGSLRKSNSLEEFNDWIKKCGDIGAGGLFITHKIDGSSMELVYKKGLLVRCVTRGDGIIGEDVTENISQVPNIPKNLGEEIDITVRGEIVMDKAVFAKEYAKEYANPRNTAASLVRKKKGGGSEAKNLRFLAYWIQTKEMIETMDKSMEFMQKWFETPPFVSSNNVDDIVLEYEKEKSCRTDIKYEIDGMVVSVNNREILDSLGEVSMRPLGQIAWKFDAAMAETRVVDVKWQVGLTGRVTGVAVVEPINIGGVIITNISLHNLSMFRELGLYKNCRVLVSRRNDVIPFIEECLGD
jgi:DNA ligase (NAD+)